MTELTDEGDKQTNKAKATTTALNVRTECISVFCAHAMQTNQNVSFHNKKCAFLLSVRIALPLMLYIPTSFYRQKDV